MGIESKIWAPIFTFVPLFGMFSLNFIGVELENPFGNDANDLPLDHFQTDMNKCLLMLLQENADLAPGVSCERCIKSFSTLADTMWFNTAHSKEFEDQDYRRLSHYEDYVGFQAG